MRPSWRLKSGIRGDADGPGGRYDGSYTRDWQYVKGSGDLDRSNARFTVTPDYPIGVFACFITDGFPHVPRSFIGTPDDSFRKRPPAEDTAGRATIGTGSVTRHRGSGVNGLRPLHLWRQ